MKYDIFLESFRTFLAGCPEEDLDEGAKYVFFSDLHMGNGSSRDDLEYNREMIETVLEKYYLEKDYYLILNGDIEDVTKFPLASIRTAWPHLLEIFNRFNERNKLRKIVGNHDYDLMLEKDYPWQLFQSLVFRMGAKKLFVFHGHQASSLYVKFDFVTDFLIRYFVRPLHIRNSGVSQDSRRRFSTERKIYRAARYLGIVTITGHTHRPLFESLSKYDNLRMALENLLFQYIDAKDDEKTALEKSIRLYRNELKKLYAVKEKLKKTQSLYVADPFLIPCIFNSGCTTGKHGITSLEIEGGKIALMYWTKGAAPRPYLESEAVATEIVEGKFFRYTIHRERLDGIFMRIELLGDVEDVGGKKP